MEPRDTLDAGSDNCPAGNTAALLLAGLAVTFQPAFTMLFAYKTCVLVPLRNGFPFCCLDWRVFRCVEQPIGPGGVLLSDCRHRGKERFLVPLFLACLTTLGMIIRLALGTAGVGALKPFEADNPFALAGKTTCAYNGPEGHLLWVFAAVDSEFLPTMFPYFLFFNFAMLFYKPQTYGLSFMVALLPVLIIIFAAVRWSNEGWSIWYAVADSQHSRSCSGLLHDRAVGCRTCASSCGIPALRKAHALGGVSVHIATSSFSTISQLTSACTTAIATAVTISANLTSHATVVTSSAPPSAHATAVISPALPTAHAITSPAPPSAHVTPHSAGAGLGCSCTGRL